MTIMCPECGGMWDVRDEHCNECGLTERDLADMEYEDWIRHGEYLGDLEREGK